MHGLGNDFVILDWRDDRSRKVPEAAARRLADRRLGIGCDQILVLRDCDTADLRMDILNQDGSPSGACGNGTRCVADMMMNELQSKLLEPLKLMRSIFIMYIVFELTLCLATA